LVVGGECCVGELWYFGVYVVGELFDVVWLVDVLDLVI